LFNARFSSAGASGIVIDGAVYHLAGEPPLATSHGWGKTWRNIDY
jgi:hypothetical protein